VTSPTPGPAPESYSAATIAALQAALAAEHAAVWAYGLIAAYLPAERAEAVADAATAHRARRDATERLLSGAGVEPVPAEPAYRVPAPVDDPADALRLAVTAETDTAETWRSAIERSPLHPVRAAALDALTGAAVRAARWRAMAGDEIVTVAFPGKP
jgi:rubrerythrin